MNGLLEGEILPDLHAGLICAYEGRVLDGAEKLIIEDGGWTAWGIRSGRIQVRVGSGSGFGAVIRAREQAWVILPNRRRLHQISPGTVLCSIRFTLERADGLPVFEKCEPFIVRGKGARELFESFPNLINSLNSQFALREGRVGHDPLPEQQVTANSLGRLLQIRSSLLDWFGRFFSVVLSHGWTLPDSSRCSPFQIGCRELERLVPLENPAIADVARNIGLSSSHFRRKFREEMGCSPSSWRKTRRFELARNLLTHSQDPIKVVAGELGFATTAHFSTWFRKLAGISPSLFRQKSHQAGV